MPSRVAAPVLMPAVARAMISLPVSAGFALLARRPAGKGSPNRSRRAEGLVIRRGMYLEKSIDWMACIGFMDRGPMRLNGLDVNRRWCWMP